MVAMFVLAACHFRHHHKKTVQKLKNGSYVYQEGDVYWYYIVSDSNSGSWSRSTVKPEKEEIEKEEEMEVQESEQGEPSNEPSEDTSDSSDSGSDSSDSGGGDSGGDGGGD